MKLRYLLFFLLFYVVNDLHFKLISPIPGLAPSPCTGGAASPTAPVAGVGAVGVGAPAFVAGAPSVVMGRVCVRKTLPRSIANSTSCGAP